MPPGIDPSGSFSYLMVIPGVISALTLGRLLEGVSLRFRYYQKTKLYPIHFAWTAIVFVAQVQFWFVSFRWAEISPNPSLPRYITFLVFPVLLYLAADVLMPKKVEDPSTFSFRTHYFEHATAFFGICCVAILSVIVLGGLLCIRDWITWHNAFRVLGVVVTLLLALVGRHWKECRRQTLHCSLTIVALISLLLFLLLPAFGINVSGDQ